MKERLLTLKQISKLKGNFIIKFYALGNNYQFIVSKDELISELRTLRSKRPKKFTVHSHGTNWHTVLIIE